MFLIAAGWPNTSVASSTSCTATRQCLNPCNQCPDWWRPACQKPFSTRCLPVTPLSGNYVPPRPSALQHSPGLCCLQWITNPVWLPKMQYLTGQDTTLILEKICCLQYDILVSSANLLTMPMYILIQIVGKNEMKWNFISFQFPLQLPSILVPYQAHGDLSIMF